MSKHGHGDDTITAHQLAKRLGIPADIVQHSIDSGQLLADKIGRTWRITETEAGNYDPVLSAVEAAALLGQVPHGTSNITKLLRSGRLVGFKDRRQWRVRLSCLRDFQAKPPLSWGSCRTAGA